MASFFGKHELSGAWKERFQDVKKLNEYTQKGLKADISDVIIKDYKLKGAIFNNASFRDVEWTDTMTGNLTFTNTVFRNNTFNNVEFISAKFTNVTFEDSEFNGIYFDSSQMTGVKFIRCKFTRFFDTHFMALENSSIEFEHTTFEAEEIGPPKISFYKSTATLSFLDSSLTKIEFVSLALPSSLTFINSKLEDVSLARSKLSKLVMENVKGGRFGFANGGSVAEAEVRNCDVGLGLAEGTIGKVTYVNSVIYSNFSSANVKELNVISCKAMNHLTLYEAKIDTLQISNCPVSELVTTDADIQNFSIEKASVVNSKFKRMKVKNLTLTDITLDRANDFSGAQVEHLNTKNITKTPELNLNLTGSNVKF